MFAVSARIAADEGAGLARSKPLQKATAQDAFAASALAGDNQHAGAAHLALVGQKTNKQALGAVLRVAMQIECG